MTIGMLCILLFAESITMHAASIPEGLTRTAGSMYTIMGESSVTIGQMVNYYLSGHTYPSFYANTDAPNIYEFCKIYMEECQAEGVKAEVAFCQSMKETGYLQFSGDVSPIQFNFAGLDATGLRDDGTVNAGRSYPSVRIGIRAHVQRLKAYAVKGTTPESYSYACVDADKFSTWWKNTIVGSAPYVEWLGSSQNPSGYGWATDPNYGYSIVNDYISKLLSASTYTTWYQGKDYSAVFDPAYYLKNNSDVARAYGTDGDKVIAHFVINGMKEGRRAKDSFDVQSYKRQYADLRNAFGNDLKSYYLHYINNGQREGRKGTGCTILQGSVTKLNGVDYSAVFDFTYYKTQYPEINRLYGSDDIAALTYFVNNGMAEGQQGISTFDVKSYLYRYADLRRAFGNNLKSYYMHYLRYGKKEGRQTTGLTSMQGYQTIYNGVDYTAVYDYNYYVEKYADIKRAFGYDDMAVLRHFVNNGMREGRQGNANFNVNIYRSRYGDLQNAFGSDLQMYYMHYLNNGIKEGRSGR